MIKYSIAIHGGAGTIRKGLLSAEQEMQYKKVLGLALDQGVEVLQDGGSAITAVERAVVVMEDSPLFNAGKGSVFNASGSHEMDASIMDGKTLNAGAVSSIQGIKNPILLARDVMDQSEHVYLTAQGAMDFAKKLNYELYSPDYFFDDYRHQQWLAVKGTDHFQLDHSADIDSKFGTVGAVACDHQGHVAAATSTGGLTNKKYGRVGDTPLIGAGNYANDSTCAISCTGHGEAFIRAVAAYDVACLMEHRGMSIQQAVEEVIYKRIKAVGGQGGMIGVDAHGEISMVFNTEGMYRACEVENQQREILIYR